MAVFCEFVQGFVPYGRQLAFLPLTGRERHATRCRSIDGALGQFARLVEYPVLTPRGSPFWSVIAHQF